MTMEQKQRGFQFYTLLLKNGVWVYYKERRRHCRHKIDKFCESNIMRKKLFFTNHLQHANEQLQRDQKPPSLQQTPSKVDLRSDGRTRGSDERRGGGGAGGGGGNSYSSNPKRRSRIHDLPMPPMGNTDEELSPPPENDVSFIDKFV